MQLYLRASRGGKLNKFYRVKKEKVNFKISKVKKIFFARSGERDPSEDKLDYLGTQATPDLFVQESFEKNYASDSKAGTSVINTYFSLMVF